MTITIGRSTAAVAIALIGALGGFSISQVTQADSAPAGATASYKSPFERDTEKMRKALQSIDAKLGGSRFGTHNVIGELERITDNTYETCREVASFGCRN